MLNQSAVDALYSATYVEDYLDSVENLPDDIIRLVTRMKEMDLATRNYLIDVNVSMERLATLTEESKEDSEEYQALNHKVQSILIGCQDLGDQKLRVVQQIQDHIENKARQLDLDRKNLESACRTEPKKSSSHPERNIKRAQRRIRPPEAFVQSSVLLPGSLSVTAYGLDGHGDTEFDNQSAPGRVYSSHTHTSVTPSSSKSSIPSTSNARAPDSAPTQIHSQEKPSPLIASSGDKKPDNSYPSSSSSQIPTSSSKKYSEKKQNETDKKKYKRRKSTKQTERIPINIPIDPDEPTYCLCDQVSYGEMIGCDNDLCPIEWFHFNCVSLTSKPKGKWYCPKCRGDKPNVMKPKSIFLKELEKYNREKEEKP